MPALLLLVVLVLLLLSLPAAVHCWTPLDASHNGGIKETLTQPAAGLKPNILFLLVDVRVQQMQLPPVAPAASTATLPV